jgi:hypothetical protein
MIVVNSLIDGKRKSWRNRRPTKVCAFTRPPEAAIVVVRSRLTMFEAMSVLFEDVCGELGLAQRTDPLRDLVAKKLVQYAQSGERDVLRLKERILFEFKSLAS